MKRTSPSFHIACLNMAQLIWSSAAHRFPSAESLWERLPDESREQIEAFVASDIAGPRPLEEVMPWPQWCLEVAA